MKTDFPVKGFHIDLRIQVMPMSALRKFAAELAGFRPEYAARRMGGNLSLRETHHHFE